MEQLYRNVYTFEGNTSAMVRLSAPGNFRSGMIIISNDSSGVNMGVRIRGNSAAQTGMEMTIAGNETFSQYFSTGRIELSCNTQNGGGSNYRVWMFG